LILQGKIYWAKILGKPVEDRFVGPCWSFDLSIDEKTKDFLINNGVAKNKIHNDGDDRGDYVTFQRKAVKKNGEAAQPYAVVDAHKKPWDDSKSIGNGSLVNVQAALNTTEFNGKTFIKPSAIALQVWTLVEYAGKGFKEKTGDDTLNDPLEAW